MEIERIEKTVKRSRIFVATIFGITIGAYLLWFFVVQEQDLSKQTATWGAFGDFIGGILNPLIAYSAFYWLTVSVLVQKRELQETKQALVDSSKAQQEQAKSAFRSAQMEAINMRFKKLNIALEAELRYRQSLINNGFNNGHYVPVLDKTGTAQKVQTLIGESNEYIEKLESDQHFLIMQSVELINDKHK
ncbi:MAG: hypothetical protein JAZ17_04795 [Candidatus Thiodiazotropha endolucinida]|nr:hypothetical protein [Candidatus Thiodiazotropha endolucinida]